MGLAWTKTELLEVCNGLKDFTCQLSQLLRIEGNGKSCISSDPLCWCFYKQEGWVMFVPVLRFELIPTMMKVYAHHHILLCNLQHLLNRKTVQPRHLLPLLPWCCSSPCILPWPLLSLSRFHILKSGQCNMFDQGFVVHAWLRIEMGWEEEAE